MNEVVLAGLLAAVLAVVMAILAVPLVARIAMAVRALDYPGGRRLQREAIPRMGGIAIAAGIAAGAALPSLMLWESWSGRVTSVEVAALLLGTGLIFWTGLIDDVMGLSPLHRLLLQTVAAGGIVMAGWSFGIVYVPLWGELHLGAWGGLITVAWIVGVTNAMNLLDGLDGLAAGVAAIIALSLVAFAWIQGNTLTVILMAAIAGACLGFLRHNWAPARIYMGDSGSLMLGFLLAVMSMHSSMKGAAAVAILVPILALGLPVIDTLLVMAVRFVAKPQGSFVRRFARMFQADRNHVHHVMVAVAPERKQIVLTIYFIASCFCAMALAVAVSRSGPLGLTMIIVEVVVVVFIRNPNIRQRIRALSMQQRHETRETFFRRPPVEKASTKTGDRRSKYA